MRYLLFFYLITTILSSMSIAQVQPPSNTIGSIDSNKNWIITKSYDGLGAIIGESKQFFDNNGRLVQAQRKSKHLVDATTFITHVLASQPIRDALGRDVAFTLEAPINNSEFMYKPNFVQNTSGSVYDYKNFDVFNSGGTEINKTNNPDPIGGQSVQGTLGWYYSSNNTWEPYTPTSNYPYTRQIIYSDGTDKIKKTSGVGEPLKMGSGHEVGSFITPIINELSHYFLIRNTFFTAAEVGNLSANLIGNATQEVSFDPNGTMMVNIFDSERHLLMSARPGNDFTPNTNTITLNALPYSVSLPSVPSGGGSCSFGSQVVRPLGDGTYFQYKSGSLVNLQSAGPYINGYGFSISSWGGKFTSDAPFSVTYTDKVSGCSSVEKTIYSNGPSYNSTNIYHFAILSDNSNVTITGDGTYTLYNMLSETAVNLLPGNKLNKGYYKLVATDGQITLTYGNKFTDITYNYYNHLGQLIATLSPEGVKNLMREVWYYYTKEEVPYFKFYDYDLQGRMIKMTAAASGSSYAFPMYYYIYRNDGKMRFFQKGYGDLNYKFNYINYDAFNRPIESGGYFPDDNGIRFNADLAASNNPMRDIIENTSSTGGLSSGTKNDVIMTYYDNPDNTHGISGYVQDEYYLRGAISKTVQYSTILNNSPNINDRVSATWYNYNEDGKVVWVIKFIKGLGYKTVDYVYDISGKLVKKIYQKNTPSETFVHYYEYDPNNSQLWKVYTNITDNYSTKILQATYIYYLHGPLKRIELATNLQGIDYTYTLGGALKAINNSNKIADPGRDSYGSGIVNPDAFGMVIDYYTDDYVNSRTTGIQIIKGVNTTPILSSENYAGNIKAISWFSKKPASVLLTNPSAENPTAYVYSYDDKYRFKESTWGINLNFGTTPASFTSTNFNKETINNSSNSSLSGYNLNGDILYLQRTNSTGALTDNLSYRYNNDDILYTNLKSVSQISPSQVIRSYSYSEVGQVTSDGIRSIQYNTFGKIKKVNGVADYIYDEVSGQRVLESGYTANQITQNTYYVDNAIYIQPVTGGVPGSITLREFELDGGAGRIGVFYPQTNTYTYELKDYLGNVRAIIDKDPQTQNLNVRTFKDYYPFGMVCQQGGLDEYRYDYQGQYSKKDKGTDWNSFNLRTYDSRIGRWLHVDPKGEFFSPYVGMGNDPILYTDPDGGSVNPGDGNPGAKLLQEVIVRPNANWNYSNSLLSLLNRQQDGGPPGWIFKAWLANAGDYFKNVGTAFKLFNNWDQGTGKDFQIFNNDRVANSFRDARKVNEAREAFYKKYRGVADLTDASLTNYKGSFGLKGLVKAGFDPIEQFVGSARIDVHVIGGAKLQFTVTNTTSMESFLYGVGPNWERSSFQMNGNTTQVYMFTEALRW